MIPIITMKTLITGSEQESQKALDKIKTFTDSKSDQSAMLYAATFTTATMDEIKTAYDRLKELDIADAALPDLLVAGLLYNDVNATVEMYNFAGELEGMTDQAASEIALETVANNLPEFEGDGKINPNHMIYSGTGHFYAWYFFGTHSSSNYRGTSFRGSGGVSEYAGRGGVRGGGRAGGGS